MKPHSRALLLLLLLSATLVLFILTPVAHARPSPELKDSIMRDSRDDRNIDSRSKTKAPTPPAAQPSANSSSKTASKTTIPVIVDHDGNVEDLISVVLLLVNEAVDVQLISYVEGDSIEGVAVNTTLKLMHLLNRTNVPMAVSTLKPKNAFPLMYRAGGLVSDVLPMLNPADLDLEGLRMRVVLQKPGQDALTDVLAKAKSPVTIVATGPLTNIAYAIQQNPAVANNIQRIWWMGGALKHPGNVFNNSNSDGSAEWNVFSDPQAAAIVWNSSVPVTLVPLDATNKVPITPELLYKLGQNKKQSRLLDVVGSMYAPTVSWVYLSPYDPFYAWDSLDTACFLEPAICSSMQEATVQVVVDGPSQGATILQQPKGGNTGGVAKKAGDLRAEGTTLSKPKRVVAAMDADASKFDAFLFKALTSASAGLPTAGGSCT